MCKIFSLDSKRGTDTDNRKLKISKCCYKSFETFKQLTNVQPSFFMPHLTGLKSSYNFKC
ncbi:hypothetical protein BpHYR1_042849 [Brachionus plicatilis]|uniref:Uncharacterized protein n=1 Tax=Brachionus plicatilis TaxID=10195 RepID=A0A3M7PKA4_BRAPC|nr:hypothetical protein BpHYR1_042849 [Brachionus plicatilis]